MYMYLVSLPVLAEMGEAECNYILLNGPMKEYLELLDDQEDTEEGRQAAYSTLVNRYCDCLFPYYGIIRKKAGPKKLDEYQAYAWERKGVPDPARPIKLPEDLVRRVMAVEQTTDFGVHGLVQASGGRFKRRQSNPRADI